MNSASPSTRRRLLVIADETVEICRDESCRKLGIHAKHDVAEGQAKRGRPRKNCPTCKERLQIQTVNGAVVRCCEHCGYQWSQRA